MLLAAAVLAAAAVHGTFGDVPAASADFSDTDESVIHRDAIEALEQAGILRGTGCTLTRLCPDEPLPRWAMAVWLVRALDGSDPPRTGRSRFADVAPGWWFRPHIERLAELGVTKGCSRDEPLFCPLEPVTRAQMASFLQRAFQLSPAAPAGFADTAGRAHESAIDAIAAAGITVGCRTDQLRYCGSRHVTRAEMAAFLHRALEFNANVTWLSTGDSYASGVGTDPHARGRCKRSPAASGPAAAKGLHRQGWSISDSHTACAGGLVQDMFNRPPGSSGYPSMWEEHLEDRPAPDRLDVITLSLGGNDIGYEDVVLACVPFTRVTELFSDGCPSEGSLRARIDSLLAPGGRCSNPSHSRARPDYACALQIVGRNHGSIVDFYVEVVTERLTERGRLYVMGYPSLIAPSREWRLLSYCWALYKPETVDMLGRLARYLNEALAEAVDRANAALGDGARVHYVDTYTPFREGRHEVCGSGQDLIHGITHVDKNPLTGWHRSFHPNDAGHAEMARILADTIRSTFRASIGRAQPWADQSATSDSTTASATRSATSLGGRRSILASGIRATHRSTSGNCNVNSATPGDPESSRTHLRYPA